MARLGIAEGTAGASAMDQPKNIVEELKHWPDDRLDQALETAIYSENSPMPTEGPLAPGYLVLAEKSRRNDIRARGPGGAEAPPQTTVAEEMLASSQGMGPGMGGPPMDPNMMPQQGMPQGMPPQGMPQEDPMQFLASLQGGPQGMPPGMPQGMPQGMPPGMPPQGMPMGPMMANTGGLIRRYANGGAVVSEEELQEKQVQEMMARGYSMDEALATVSGRIGAYLSESYQEPDRRFTPGPGRGRTRGGASSPVPIVPDTVVAEEGPPLVPSVNALASQQVGPMSGGPPSELDSFLAGVVPPAATGQGAALPPGTDPTVDPVPQVGGDPRGLGIGTRMPQMNPEYMDQMNIMRTRMDELGSAGAAESAALREQIANMSMMSAPKQQNYMDPARLAFAAGLMGGRTVGEGISAGLKASSPYMQQGINQRNRDREIANRQQLENLRTQYTIAETQRGQEINTLNRQLGSLERGADRDLGMQEFGIAQENLFKRQTNANDQKALDRAFQEDQQAQRIAASLEEVGVRMTASRIQFMTAELIDAQQSVVDSEAYQSLLMVSQSDSYSEKEREQARQQAANMMNDASVGVQTSFTQMFGDRSGNRSSHIAMNDRS